MMTAPVKTTLSFSWLSFQLLTFIYNEQICSHPFLMFDKTVRVTIKTREFVSQRPESSMFLSKYIFLFAFWTTS